MAPQLPFYGVTKPLRCPAESRAAIGSRAAVRDRLLVKLCFPDAVRVSLVSFVPAPRAFRAVLIVPRSRLAEFYVESTASRAAARTPFPRKARGAGFLSK